MSNKPQQILTSELRTSTAMFLNFVNILDLHFILKFTSYNKVSKTRSGFVFIYINSTITRVQKKLKIYFSIRLNY